MVFLCNSASTDTDPDKFYLGELFFILRFDK